MRGGVRLPGLAGQLLIESGEGPGVGFLKAGAQATFADADDRLAVVQQVDRVFAMGRVVSVARAGPHTPWGRTPPPPCHDAPSA